MGLIVRIIKKSIDGVWYQKLSSQEKNDLKEAIALKFYDAVKNIDQGFKMENNYIVFPGYVAYYALDSYLGPGPRLNDEKDYPWIFTAIKSALAEIQNKNNHNNNHCLMMGMMMKTMFVMAIAFR